MAGQYAQHRFRVLDGNGELTQWAKRFSESKREEMSIRIFKDNTIGDAVLIDYDLGAELYDRIIAFRPAKS